MNAKTKTEQTCTMCYKPLHRGQDSHDCCHECDVQQLEWLAEHRAEFPPVKTDFKKAA